jgi:hypothetical protein
MDEEKMAALLSIIIKNIKATLTKKNIPITTLEKGIVVQNVLDNISITISEGLSSVLNIKENDLEGLIKKSLQEWKTQTLPSNSFLKFE